MEKKNRITRMGFVADESIDYFIQILVTSTFLGYILSAIGFNDAMQGIITNVTTFCLGAQLIAPLLAGKRVKRIVTVAMFLSHISFTLIYLLPISSLPDGATSVILVALLFFGFLVNNAVKPSRLTWLMTSVPKEKRGGFTAVKEIISLIGGIIISLSFGVIADSFRKDNGDPESEYYLICFVALLLMTVIHTVSLVISTEHEPSAELAKKEKSGVLSVLKNPAVGKIMVVDLLWHISTSFSVSFFPSYLREELAFSFTEITALSTVSLLARIVMSPLMGRIADKYSFKTSMALSFGFKCVGLMAILFTFPGQMRWFYVVYCLFTGFAMAGANSGFLNIVYDYIPERDRASVLGIKSTAAGITGFLAAIISGAWLSVIQENGGINLCGITFYAQQIQSLVSIVVIAIVTVYTYTVIGKLKKVEE